MKSLALRGMNKIGSAMSHKQRRFVLDRLGVAALLDSFAGEEFAELRLPNGLSLSFSPLLHGRICKGGQLALDPRVAQAVEANLARGEVFYDVGANLGVFSFLAAPWVGDKGAVFAFEPEPNNILCIERSLKRSPLPNVALQGIAVGRRDGAMTFDRRDGAFSGRLVEGEDLARSDNLCELRVRALDSLLADGFPPPNLLKITVQGGEGSVLEGARQMLRRHKPAVLCQMHPRNPAGVNRVFAVLKDAGYLCHLIGASAEALSAETANEGARGAAEGAGGMIGEANCETNDQSAVFVEAPLDWNRPYHVLARPA